MIYDRIVDHKEPLNAARVDASAEHSKSQALESLDRVITFMKF